MDTHDRTEAGFRERDAGDPGLPDLQLGRSGLARAQALVDELSLSQSHQHCALFLWDRSIGRLRLAAQHWGAGEDLGEVRAGLWSVGLDGICGRAFASRAPVLVADIEAEPSFLSYPGSRTRSELSVPVFIDGRAVGVVNLESPRVGAYDQADIEAVNSWIESVRGTIEGFFADMS